MFYVKLSAEDCKSIMRTADQAQHAHELVPRSRRLSVYAVLSTQTHQLLLQFSNCPLELICVLTPPHVLRLALLKRTLLDSDLLVKERKLFVPPDQLRQRTGCDEEACVSFMMSESSLYDEAHARAAARGP